MKFFDKKTAQALLTILVFALILMFLYVAWRAIITFLFAIFFAYILEAPVSRLQVWLKGSRPAAIAMVYLLFVGVLAVTFSLVGPPVMEEVQKLTQQTPEMGKKISPGNLVHGFGAKHGWNRDTVDLIARYLDEHQSELIATTQNFTLRAAKSIQNMWWLLLVPILAIFFLKDGHQLSQNIINSVEDPRNRRMVADTVQEMDSMLGHFIRAQLTLAGLAMVVVTFALWIMRVPYAFALGPAAGALEFIPVVGPALGGLAGAGSCPAFWLWPHVVALDRSAGMARHPGLCDLAAHPGPYAGTSSPDGFVRGICRWRSGRGDRRVSIHSCAGHPENSLAYVDAVSQDGAEKQWLSRTFVAPEAAWRVKRVPAANLPVVSLQKGKYEIKTL